MISNHKDKKLKPTQLKTRVDKLATHFAASWYVAMDSQTLGKKPKTIQLFGQPLVAWRDGNGHPVIMERYCSHMGASLAIGELVDGCIQCPFHLWRFESSGECVFIPEAEYIPPKARQFTYVTVERYGYIWIWYGSKTPLFPLPKFPAAEEERHKYMPFSYAVKGKTTVRRVLENPYDYYHLISVHKLKASGSSIKFTLLNKKYPEQQSELPIAKEAWFGSTTDFLINMGKLGMLVAKPLGLNAKVFRLRIDAWPTGTIVTAFTDGKEKYTLLSCPTPISENETIMNISIMIKKTGNLLLDVLYYFLFSRQSKSGSIQDLPIFDTIKADGGGAYVKQDLGVLKFREFYQSWVDKVE